MKSKHSIVPIALRPDDAAAMLGMSKTSLDKLVKAGKITPPVAVPHLRGVKLYDFERLIHDWRAYRDEAENGSANPWDET